MSVLEKMDAFLAEAGSTGEVSVAPLGDYTGFEQGVTNSSPAVLEHTEPNRPYAGSGQDAVNSGQKSLGHTAESNRLLRPRETPPRPNRLRKSRGGQAIGDGSFARSEVVAKHESNGGPDETAQVFAAEQSPLEQKLRDHVNRRASPKASQRARAPHEPRRSEMVSESTSEDIVGAVRSAIAKAHAKLYDAFVVMDTSNTGRLSRSELLVGLESMNLGLLPETLNRFIDSVDIDDDGNISFQEFWQAFARYDHEDVSRQTWFPPSPSSASISVAPPTLSSGTTSAASNPSDDDSPMKSCDVQDDKNELGASEVLFSSDVPMSHVARFSALRITLHSASALSASDRGGGSFSSRSTPSIYVSMRVGDLEKRKSTLRPRSAELEWNEDFAFGISDEGHVEGLPQHSGTMIEIAVRQQRRLGRNRTIGRWALQLWSLLQDSTAFVTRCDPTDTAVASIGCWSFVRDGTFPISNSSGNSGLLKLSIELRAPIGPQHVRLSEDRSSVKAPRHVGKQSEQASSNSLLAGPQMMTTADITDANGKAATECDVTAVDEAAEPPPTLERNVVVTVVQASALYTTGKRGDVADVCCLVSLKGSENEEHHTKSVRYTPECIWDERVDFRCVPRGELVDLTVAIVERDAVESNLCLGQVIVPLAASTQRWHTGRKMHKLTRPPRSVEYYGELAEGELLLDIAIEDPQLPVLDIDRISLLNTTTTVQDSAIVEFVEVKEDSLENDSEMGKSELIEVRDEAERIHSIVPMKLEHGTPQCKNVGLDLKLASDAEYARAHYASEEPPSVIDNLVSELIESSTRTKLEHSRRLEAELELRTLRTQIGQAIVEQREFSSEASLASSPVLPSVAPLPSSSTLSSSYDLHANHEPSPRALHRSPEAVPPSSHTLPSAVDTTHELNPVTVSNPELALLREQLSRLHVERRFLKGEIAAKDTLLRKLTQQHRAQTLDLDMLQERAEQLAAEAQSATEMVEKSNSETARLTRLVAELGTENERLRDSEASAKKEARMARAEAQRHVAEAGRLGAVDIMQSREIEALSSKLQQQSESLEISSDGKERELQRSKALERELDDSRRVCEDALRRLAEVETERDSLVGLRADANLQGRELVQLREKFHVACQSEAKTAARLKMAHLTIERQARRATVARVQTQLVRITLSALRGIRADLGAMKCSVVELNDALVEQLGTLHRFWRPPTKTRSLPVEEETPCLQSLNARFNRSVSCSVIMESEVRSDGVEAILTVKESNSVAVESSSSRRMFVFDRVGTDPCGEGPESEANEFISTLLRNDTAGCAITLGPAASKATSVVLTALFKALNCQPWQRILFSCVSVRDNDAFDAIDLDFPEHLHRRSLGQVSNRSSGGLRKLELQRDCAILQGGALVAAGARVVELFSARQAALARMLCVEAVENSEDRGHMVMSFRIGKSDLAKNVSSDRPGFRLDMVELASVGGAMLTSHSHGALVDLLAVADRREHHFNKCLLTSTICRDSVPNTLVHVTISSHSSANDVLGALQFARSVRICQPEGPRAPQRQSPVREAAAILRETSSRHRPPHASRMHTRRPRKVLSGNEAPRGPFRSFEYIGAWASPVDLASHVAR